MDPNMPGMPPMPPMQLHPVNSPQNAQQLPYGFEEHAGQRPPPPPPPPAYVEDTGFEQINLGEVRFDVDGAEIGKAEDVEKAAKAFGLTEEKSAERARARARVRFDLSVRGRGRPAVLRERRSG